MWRARCAVLRHFPNKANRTVPLHFATSKASARLGKVSIALIGVWAANVAAADLVSFRWYPVKDEAENSSRNSPPSGA